MRCRPGASCTPPFPAALLQAVPAALAGLPAESRPPRPLRAPARPDARLPGTLQALQSYLPPGASFLLLNGLAYSLRDFNLYELVDAIRAEVGGSRRGLMRAAALGRASGGGTRGAVRRAGGWRAGALGAPVRPDRHRTPMPHVCRSGCGTSCALRGCRRAPHAPPRWPVAAAGLRARVLRGWR